MASWWARAACVQAGRPTMPSVSAFVYLLRCRDGSLYCGWTVDLTRRVAAHNAGSGAAYTRSRRPATLVWWEACADRSAALRREIAVKRLPRARKLALVRAATLLPPPIIPASSP